MYQINYSNDLGVTKTSMQPGHYWTYAGLPHPKKRTVRLENVCYICLVWRVKTPVFSQASRTWKAEFGFSGWFRHLCSCVHFTVQEKSLFSCCKEIPSLVISICNVGQNAHFFFFYAKIYSKVENRMRPQQPEVDSLFRSLLSL